MAKPRVFISSTYYDLRSIRNDLARDIEALGFEAVIHERSDVPYGNDEVLEAYCEREIGLCDMLVSVIGGRFGSQSVQEPYSISQTELRTAQKLGKMVYVFVDEPVFFEYRTYEANRESTGINYRSVDDPKIFKFLDELSSLKVNNVTASFRTSYDISTFLRAQWSGLFHRFLNERSRETQLRRVQDITSAAETLNRLVTIFSEESELRSQNVNYILLIDHPLFATLRKKLNPGYRVFFTTLTELDDWLRFGRAFARSDSSKIPAFHRWVDKNGRVLRIARDLFETDGTLKIIGPENYSKRKVESAELFASAEDEETTDEIPF